jgi:hypothetical protein
MSEAPLLVNADGSPTINELIEHLVAGTEVWEWEQRALNDRLAALADENRNLLVRAETAETRVAELEVEASLTFRRRFRRRFTMSTRR